MVQGSSQKAEIENNSGAPVVSGAKATDQAKFLATAEISMPVSFSPVCNVPSKKGELAARKQFFGPNRRYAVAPIHTRFDDIEWFVWDAEHELSNMTRAEVIRQSPTLEAALCGLQAR